MIVDASNSNNPLDMKVLDYMRSGANLTEERKGRVTFEEWLARIRVDDPLTCNFSGHRRAEMSRRDLPIPSVQQLADSAVTNGVPGVVAAIADEESIEVGISGFATVDTAPMRRDAVVRIASLTKPIIATATLALVERGVFDLRDLVARWLPELASPRILTTPSSELDDAAPAQKPILIEHLLGLQGGLGFTNEFDTPLAHALIATGQGPPDPSTLPSLDAWLAEIARLPLVHEPGEGWTYNTGIDLAGALLVRAMNASLGKVLDDTVTGPCRMSDTGFHLRPDQISRTATSYRNGANGLVVVDSPDGAWASPPRFESGAGGLVSTLDDLVAFGRMLVASGRAHGRRVLSHASVERLMLPVTAGEPDNPFLEGRAWALGAAVDVAEREPWHVRGRYGWSGSTGTAFAVFPDSSHVAIWLSQLAMEGPDDDARIHPFSSLAAARAARSRDTGRT